MLTYVYSIFGTGFSTGISNDDPKLKDLTPPLDAQIRSKAKEVLIEDELTRRRSVNPQAFRQYMLIVRRKQKLAYANEGAEKAKHEEEIANRKRKLEEKEKWEGESVLFNPYPPGYNPQGLILRRLSIQVYRSGRLRISSSSNIFS
jgi:hypothetical protein